MSGYPYDEAVLDDIARRLLEAVPAMYRVPDAPPAGRGDLAAVLQVLAAPLAVVRQNIHELHADLFIDTADDRIIPYLAEMVGTRLVFPDADSNRRDVRGTVGWRRRKGTPNTLEDMGRELVAQPVVVQEGWKRVQLAQDLKLLRGERVAPDLRPAVVAEQASGPLDALFHAVDVRRISARTGRHHPRHIAHWSFPTLTFPLAESTATPTPPPPAAVPPFDVRFAVDALGVRQPLRARRVGDDRRPFTDRIPEQHFAADPGRWFGQQGGFAIKVCGLPGGIAERAGVDSGGTGRVAARTVASAQVGRGAVTITALDLPSRGWRGGIEVELGLVPVLPAGPDAWAPDVAAFTVRASIELDASGVVSASSTGGAGSAAVRVPMLRLRPSGGAPARHFPGATLELASATPGATAAAAVFGLAREGFLEGVLHVDVPASAVDGELLFHIAGDGSLYRALEPGTGTPAEMPESGGVRLLADDALATTGPGAAWPPLPMEAEPRMLSRVPSAPGRGPKMLHGGRPVRRTGGGMVGIGGGAECALSFAVQVQDPGGADFVPFQRLSWTGTNTGAARWTALGSDGLPVAAGDTAQTLAAIAALRAADPAAVALAVRFECSIDQASLCPAEVAWTSDDGRTTLIHLPQLDADAPDPAVVWGTEPQFAVVSAPVRVGEDGSTWAFDSTAARRAALGAVAPIEEAAGQRRRRVRGRRLCAWGREDWTAVPPETLAFTGEGRLDVDVEHGLFAFAAEEPPQRWPAHVAGPAVPVPPSVTVDREEGATMHLGARPAAREPVVDARLARPTRLVSRSGALHRDAPADWHDIPRYPSLTAALAAVSARWQALTLAEAEAEAGAVAEVVQFEDSATYRGEAPEWPDVPADAAVAGATALSLTIQAAERERPVILLDQAAGWTAPATAQYAALTLIGLAVGRDRDPVPADVTLGFPRASVVAIDLCSVLEAEAAIEFPDVADGARVTLRRCETGALTLLGTGDLTIADSIVDARPTALRVPEGELTLDRVSVGGDVRARILRASEVIFDGDVEVEDRFHGCVRFSRVASGSVLPRIHRVAWDTPIRVVSRNRRAPAWWRLHEDCDPAIARGAENGSEMGAFATTQVAARRAGLERRLLEFTPAGLVSGIIRTD